MIKFLSLASGSRGNCYYVDYGDTSILIDGGVGIRNINKILKDYAISLKDIKAVFVTHDHVDHIKAVGHLAEQYNLPVYATPEVHEGIRKSYCIKKKLDEACIKYIRKGETVEVGCMKIFCFDVPHDSTDNVGYSIEIGGRFFTFITDAGRITEEMNKYIQRTDYLVMEANYDETMLAQGPYPIHLQERIADGTGHLCNRELAYYLAENFPPRLKRLWLCHLSKENNHPELALKIVEEALNTKGIMNGRDVEIVALNRTEPTGVFEI